MSKIPSNSGFPFGPSRLYQTGDVEKNKGHVVSRLKQNHIAASIFTAPPKATPAQKKAMKNHSFKVVTEKGKNPDFRVSNTALGYIKFHR